MEAGRVPLSKLENNFVVEQQFQFHFAIEFVIGGIL